MKSKDNKTKPPSSAPATANKLAHSCKEVAALLGVSTRSLRRLEQRGLLKPCRALRKKLYAASAVTDFLKETS